MDGKRRFTFKIYVDADACPVKTEIINSASRNKIGVFIISNGGIRPSHNPLVKTIVVDSGPDEADNWIIEHIKKNDVVITSDVPLSSKSIEKGACVISHRGELLNSNNIGIKSATRDLMSELRSSNPFYQGQEKGFKKADRIKFMNTLETVLQTIKKSL